jgi:rare lipoprotein A
MARLTRIIALILPLGALLGGCAETQFVMHAAKQFSPLANEKARGTYKIGKPYKIAGVYYYPNVDYNYSEAGVASWYGPKFHGRLTANGARFDMNEVTAAHRTLPLPSMVRVTNLRNGRSLKILVNDRGPFSRGRIIDLSRRSAQLLGVIRAGTAPVRVEIIADESRQLAAIAQGKSVKPISAAPSDDVKIARLSDEGVLQQPARRPRPAPELQRVTALPFEPSVSNTVIATQPKIYIQAGAFTHRILATKMKRLLDPIGPAEVAEAVIGRLHFYRVRIGPIGSVQKADQLLELVVASGYPEARLVVD